MYSITLEVNQICNFSCDYCYLGKLSSKRMDFVTAYQAMEIAFLNAQRHPDHDGNVNVYISFGCIRIYISCLVY